jgi:hypothetical protein
VSITCRTEIPLPVSGNFCDFSSKIIKIDRFHFGRTGLSLAVAEIRPLPASGNFGIFRQKSSKIDHFSFGPEGLSLAVTEIRPLPVLG